jgi:hypothetical protein
MIAVIFESMPAAGQETAYLDIAASLRADLEAIDGFISVERYESLTTPRQAPLAFLLPRRDSDNRVAQPPQAPRRPNRRSRRRVHRLSRPHRRRDARLWPERSCRGPADSRAVHLD